ncbi:MAG: SIS domain-containing protein [Rhizobium sp.]|nr:SIS domain-containing protein [Rhizobium sp.]
MTMTETHMRREIDEIPDACARLLDTSGKAIKDAGAALREKDPAFLCTIARGSSDHASLFVKYAIELTTGKAVASLGPSLASIYGVKLSLGQAAVLSVSQSGQSPDIISLVESAGQAGALTIALTNTPASPLWEKSQVKIDIAAGPELAVAATKSYVNSAVAGLAILAEWTGNAELGRAVNDLPGHFRKALSLDWSPLSGALENAESLYVLGRGPALAIASEAALKFKETADYHAEAYSSAEVLHGPVALVDRSFPVLALAARDAAEDSVSTIAENIACRGAPTFLTSDRAETSTRLPFVATGHPITDALCLIVPFYGFVEALSRRRGYDPDRPAALSKVTKTK